MEQPGARCQEYPSKNSTGQRWSVAADKLDNFSNPASWIASAKRKGSPWDHVFKNVSPMSSNPVTGIELVFLNSSILGPSLEFHKGVARTASTPAMVVLSSRSVKYEIGINQDCACWTGHGPRDESRSHDGTRDS